MMGVSFLGRDLFQLPPSHEGELYKGGNSGRTEEISTPALA